MSGDMDGKKLEGLSIGQPPYLVVIALEAARRMLRHEYPRKNIVVPFPTATTQSLKVGETVFPDLQDSYFDAFTDTSSHPLVRFPLSEVQTGKPTRTHLDVRLPKP